MEILKFSWYKTKSLSEICYGIVVFGYVNREKKVEIRKRRLIKFSCLFFLAPTLTHNSSNKAIILARRDRI